MRCLQVFRGRINVAELTNRILEILCSESLQDDISVRRSATFGYIRSAKLFNTPTIRLINAHKADHHEVKVFITTHWA